MYNIGTLISSFIVLGIMLSLYMLPSIIAFRRHHHNRGSILMLNLFLGWTLLGWVIALSMSASGIRKDVA